MKRKNEPNPTQGTRLISMREVAERVLFTRTHVGRLIKCKQFPAPIKLGASRIAFLEAEIEQWIAERAAQRESVARLRNHCAK